MFALLRLDCDGKEPVHYRTLLQTLAVMAQHEGPAAFFDFAKDSAGLMRTSRMKLPGKPFTSSSWQFP